MNSESTNSQSKPDLSSETTAKEGYRKTKYGWIPEEWKLYRFDNVFKFIKSYSFSRNDLTFNEDEGDTYYIHYGDIHTKFDSLILHLGSENHSGIPLLKRASKPDKELTYLAEGDLVIADASEDYDGVGECVEIGELNNSKRIVAGLHTLVARDKSGKTANRYRAYILKSWPVAKELKKIATGISVYGISKSNLSKLKIPLPSLPEQKKIANILSTWDKAIDKIEKLITKKKELKKGLMQQLLTVSKGKSVPSIRFPDFKDKWDYGSIKSISNVVTGSTPKTSKREYYDGDYFFVSPNDMTDTKYVNNTETTLTQAGFENGRIVPKGSTLFVGIGSTIGKTAIAGKDLTTNQQIHAIITDNEKCLGEYFYYQLTNMSGRIKLLAGTQAVPILNKTNFQSVRIPLPPIDEQKKIIQVFTNLDLQIEKLRKESTKISLQKKGLMQQLLSGKTRVKEQ